MRKTRHYAAGDVTLSVARFEGRLAGQFLAEAEFADDAAMAALPHPAFAVREITEDPRYTRGRTGQGGGS